MKKLEEGELVEKVHLGAGSSRWGESGSGGCVPTLEEKGLSAGWIAVDGFSLLKKPTKALQDAIGLGRTRQRWVAKVSKVRYRSGN